MKKQFLIQNLESGKYYDPNGDWQQDVIDAGYWDTEIQAIACIKEWLKDHYVTIIPVYSPD
jgi:hypothetical protein